MVAKRGGLGRNLSALLSHTAEMTVTTPVAGNTMGVRLTLNVHALQPGKYQPRRHMDDVGLTELADSIKKQGLLQPIVVRPIGEARYEIIAGERRWRACQLVGLEDIPVLVRDVGDQAAMAMALIENLQRDDLNPMDQARAMHRLTEEFSMTHQQVADVLSKSRTAVTNYLRLMQLTPEVCDLLEHNAFDMGHARSLLTLDPAQQIDVARVIIDKRLSVREAEALVARVRERSVSREQATETPKDYVAHLQALSYQLQTKVTLKQGKAGKGCVMIHYNDARMFDRVIQQLLSLEE